MMIAVIPARGGSKRLPKKNIVPFAGSHSSIAVVKRRHKLGPIEKGRFRPAYRPGMRSQDMAEQAQADLHSKGAA